ncbi:MAG: hypothetical protein K2Q18_02500 [Bdellovibrionales bacterium]|nr:hypothetical protein [Bdellovibrionales bacterium]
MFTKNKGASKLTIKRVSTSPYFSSDFNHRESLALEPLVDVLEMSDPEHSDILITNTHTNFKELPSDQLDNLKLIIHPNSGYDNIPLDFVKGTKATVVIGSTIRAQAVAQYIMSALLHHYSPISIERYWDTERKWPRKLISDLKITIIGYGHIGKILNTFLNPIAKSVSIYDPYENLPTLNHKFSDVVILACGLNARNRHIVDKNFLNQVKSDALIINAARGPLVKSVDLINFLSANSEAAAVLDVFEKEPNDFSEFKHLKNVKVTSHIAGVFKDIDQHTIDFEVAVLKDYIALSNFDFQNKYQKMILQNKLRQDVGLI